MFFALYLNFLHALPCPPAQAEAEMTPKPERDISLLGCWGGGTVEQKAWGRP
jgi:hypothetical protein